MANSEYLNKVGIDTSEFQREMKKINANLKNLGTQIKFAALKCYC